VAVTGDFMRLRLLQDRLRQAAQGGARRDMVLALANEAHRQVIEGVSRKRDPYGNSWAARKNKGGWPLLDKTGAMVNSFTVRTRPTGFSIWARDYAAYHEQGTSRMPARILWPRPDLGLGPIWGDAFLRTSGDVMRAFMGAV
jgi:phage gpG-like protein